MELAMTSAMKTETQTLSRFNKAPKKLMYQVTDGTAEALMASADSIYRLNFGSVFIKNSEFGSYFNSATQQQTLFLNMLEEAYDGRIHSKQIKSEDFEEGYEKIPVNVCFLSDPSMFNDKSSLKSAFHTKLESGLGRRLETIFVPPKPEIMVGHSEQKIRELREKAKMLGNQLFGIYCKIPENVKYRLLPETHEMLTNYKSKLVDEKNASNDHLLKKEIKSRELKALKRAGRLAALNHPQDFTIKTTDMEQAIAITEWLGGGLEKFINYRPKSNDKYDKLFNFFKTHSGEEFTKSELTNNRFRELGFTRDGFRKNFEVYIQTVEEIAAYEGYTLNQRKADRNGVYYSLIKIQTEPLSNGVKGLDDIILSENVQECKLCSDLKNLKTTNNNNFANSANIDAEPISDIKEGENVQQ